MITKNLTILYRTNKTKMIKMTYITINDLSNTIRNNLYKIPHDVDVVVGIPRSGMIPASIISEYLNVPLIDLYSFADGNTDGCGGGRHKTFGKKSRSGKILVVDDTVWSGGSKKEAKELLKKYSDMSQFIYMVPYLEGPSYSDIDIFLEDVRLYTHGFRTCVIYEWNIFNHYVTGNYMFDMDGVLCVDPMDERKKEEYEKYIQNAIPLITPTSPIGSIVTYRLEKYRDVTEKWLKDNNIKYKNLVMFDASSWEDRNSSGISPAQYKGKIYANDRIATCFIESDRVQAEQIHMLTGKPVYCYSNNILYGNEYKGQ